MTIKKLLARVGAMQTDLAEFCKVSKATISLVISKGQWPKRRAERLRTDMTEFFLTRGVDEKSVDKALRAKKTGDEAATSAPAVLQHPITHSNAMEDPMLLQNETLTPAARKHFGLFRNPFVDDITSAEDIFMSPDIRFCREAMWDAAKHGGFCAIVGESGSGKSTLREEMHERIKRENAPAIVIEPYVLAMEENDGKGKTLKSSQIAETIISTLDPTAGVKRTPHARFKQVHDLLKASYKSGNTHVLLIEEAHCLPIATLKHLKRFLELKDGFARLLGAILIGQPELKLRLSDRNPEVREVVQRCEVVELGPLDRHVEGYVKHKLGRANVKVEEVFEADTYDAIRTKLSRAPRGGKVGEVSICYPLVVNNLLARAMNNAAMLGVEKVSGELILEAA
jgi:type II secretory pathway predicted ATPase ExeA